MGQQASVFNMKAKEVEPENESEQQKEKVPWRPMRKDPDSKVIKSTFMITSIYNVCWTKNILNEQILPTLKCSKG